MSRTTLGFIWTGMLYLLVGAALGVVFLVAPSTIKLQAVHVHLNLVGFVIFIIFGVAYHILPRFRGRPLHSEGLAWFQFLAANVGLLGLALFWALGAYFEIAGIKVITTAFGSVLGLSILLFVYNMARTLWAGTKTA